MHASAMVRVSYIFCSTFKCHGIKHALSQYCFNMDAFLPFIEHSYNCRDSWEDEAIDLTCTDCYPDGVDGRYNCSCWANPPIERDGPIYRTCQDAYRRGETKSGVYTLKPNNLESFEVSC